MCEHQMKDFEKMSQEEKLRLAQANDTDPDSLDLLSQCGNDEIQEAVAANRQTYPKTLSRLSRAPYWSTRLNAALNPNTPREDKEWLRDCDEDRDVSYSAGRSLSLSGN